MRGYSWLSGRPTSVAGVGQYRRENHGIAAPLAALGVIAGLLVMATPAHAQFPSSPCNYKWAGVCYRDLTDAEIVMRDTNASNALLVATGEDASFIYYELEDVPKLPGTSWRGTHYSSQTYPVLGPAFPTYSEARAFVFDRAARPSKRLPGKIASDDLAYRGQTVDSSGRIIDYFSHNYTPVPATYVDVTDSVQYRYCNQFTDGFPEAKISKAFHFVYSPDETTPYYARPDLISLAFNNCRQANREWYRIYGFRNLEVRETAGISCNSGYALVGNTCVGNVQTQIEKVPAYFVEPAAQPQVCETNESNPCNPADGTKTQVEADYASSAEGGLSFKRYYNSKGAYRSFAGSAVGWRHSYARALDEQPDKGPVTHFSAPVGRSSNYASASDACTQGWDEIKTTVWGGQLSTATATYSGGDVCSVGEGGITKAFVSVRSTVPWVTFTPSTTTKTITRPSGVSYRFVQNGSAWLNELNPALKLEQSGSFWIFTDAGDTQETYNSSGQLVAITKRNGQSEMLEYNLTAAQGGDDDSRTLDRVTGPFGHVLTFGYDAKGRLSRVTTPDGVIDYQYDLNRNLEGVTFPDGSARQYVYEDYELPNHLTGLIDENGSRFATWDYDAAGRAILSEHAGDKEQVQFTYNADGTTTLAMGNGATRTYTYGIEQGRLVEKDLSGSVCSSCLDGNVKTRTYDNNGFVEEVTDWNGNVTKTQRNSDGLVTTLTDALGSTEQRVTTMTWHGTYRLPESVRSPRNDTNYSYDANGNLTSIVVTDGATSRSWSMTYNPTGQVLTIDGPRTDTTDVTILAYSDCATGGGCGQLASITNALGQVVTFDSYDASGRPTQVTDSNGLETSLAYDVRGNLVSITQTPTVGAARTTSMTYDNVGQMATVAMPSGHVLTYTYSNARYLSSVTDNFGNTTEYTYDAMGNLAGQETYDPTGTLAKATDYVYDLSNRLSSITDGALNSTSLTIDDVGNLTDLTDAALAHTIHGYDALNRLIQTQDPLLGYTDYSYDAHSNLTTVTAPNGANTTYEYDGLDNLIKEISPDRGTITYTHDAAGNISTMVDARGKTTSYTYDALNRIIGITLDNLGTITYEYDTGANSAGRLSKITDPSGETSWTYNNFGEVTSKTQKVGTVSFTTSHAYDPSGRMTAVTLPSGKSVAYSYDTFLPTSVTVDTTTILSGASYEPFGPINGWAWGNGSPHSRSFDLRGLMDSQSMVTDVRTLSYDSVGALIALDDGRHDLDFSYDLLSRVTDFSAAGVSALASQDYTYDENGNRETLVQNSTAYGYTINANSNRLASTTGPVAKTYTYDAAGNITGDGIHSYGYDDRGRLTSVNSGSVTYVHNGQGQRVKKIDGATTVLYVYDEAGNLIGEYDANGTPIMEHVWFDGAPVAALTGAAVYYVHTDHLGTPRIVTSGTTAVWRWESGPFGEEGADEDPDGNSIAFTYNLRFPGQYYDEETGLHYNYFRTYDPSTGRYLESDPIGLGGGLNTYGYAYQNPLIWTDPYGLDPASAAAVAEGIALCTGPQAAACAGAAAVAAVGGLSIYTGTKIYDTFATQIGAGIDAAVEACSTDDDDECEQLYATDTATCAGIARVRGPRAGADCHASAAERYAACLAGRPIPPLNTWNN